MDGTANDKGVSPDSEPRLLRFMVNGRPCYAMKWRDERTENRRETDYVMREAGVAETFCLLVDCPLRVPGTPDVVSVETSGRTITRAETTWDIAVTVWEDGAIEPGDMKIFLSFIRNGNQVKAAAALGMKEQTLRARVAKWLLRGSAYARIYAVHQDIKETPQKPKIVPNYDKTLFENLAGPDVEAHGNSVSTVVIEIEVRHGNSNCPIGRRGRGRTRPGRLGRTGTDV